MKKIRLPQQTFAFTLVELLVVISIIAVLASLTITGTGSAMLAAKKVSAKNDMMQLSTAITCFNTEYGKYPAGTTITGTNDLTFGMNSGNYYIVNTLRCVSTGTAENTRQIKFLQPKVTDSKKGSVNKGDGNWYDPWGVQYLLFIDGDYDETITVRNAFSDFTTNPSFGVGTASVGYYLKMKQKSSATNLGTAISYGSNKQSILLSWQ